MQVLFHQPVSHWSIRRLVIQRADKLSIDSSHDLMYREFVSLMPTFACVIPEKFTDSASKWGDNFKIMWTLSIRRTCRWQGYCADELYIQATYKRIRRRTPAFIVCRMLYLAFLTRRTGLLFKFGWLQVRMTPDHGEISSGVLSLQPG